MDLACLGEKRLPKYKKETNLQTYNNNIKKYNTMLFHKNTFNAKNPLNLCSMFNLIERMNNQK